MAVMCNGLCLFLDYFKNAPIIYIYRMQSNDDHLYTITLNTCSIPPERGPDWTLGDPVAQSLHGV